MSDQAPCPTCDAIRAELVEVTEERDALLDEVADLRRRIEQIEDDASYRAGQDLVAELRAEREAHSETLGKLDAIRSALADKW